MAHSLMTGHGSSRSTRFALTKFRPPALPAPGDARRIRVFAWVPLSRIPGHPQKGDYEEAAARHARDTH